MAGKGVKMKITDDDILDYLWDETLSNIARATLIHYMGHRLGTYDINALRDDDFDRFALLHRTELYAGMTLSKSQFRVRLNQLVEKGRILPRLGKDSKAFVINADVKAVAISAITFWQNAGLPFGYTDETRTCMKTIPAESINVFNLTAACYRLLRCEYPIYQMKGE